jgi:hypothetical protein
MTDSIGVGISLPRKIMAQIDSERGDVSRSRFLLRLIEAHERGHGMTIQNDQPIEEIETSVSNEPTGD